MNNTELVWNAVKAAKEPISSHDLCHATQLDYHQVGHALSRLRELKILKVQRQADGLHGSCLYSPARPGATYKARKVKGGAKSKAGTERKRKSRALAKINTLKAPPDPRTYVPACWLGEYWRETPRTSRFELDANSFSTYSYKTLDNNEREVF